MARNTMAMTMQISGMDNIERWIKELDISLQKKILTQALKTAAAPIVAAAKSNAPKRTGALRRSIDSVIRVYPSGVFLAVIGPMHMRVVQEKSPKGRNRLRAATPADKQDKVINPAKYAHLVEYGHRSVNGGGALSNEREGPIKGMWNAVNKNKRISRGELAVTSFIAPRPFLVPAFNQNKEKALQALEYGVVKAIEAETRRINRNLSKRKITVKLAA